MALAEAFNCDRASDKPIPNVYQRRVFISYRIPRVRVPLHRRERIANDPMVDEANVGPPFHVCRDVFEVLAHQVSFKRPIPLFALRIFSFA